MKKNNWIIAGIVIIAFILISYLFYDSFALSEGKEILGTDTFMRLVRVDQLLNDHTWYDNTIYDSNAPFGEVLHWTKPLDILLIVFSMPLRIFMDNSEAVKAVGILIGPVIGIALIIGLIWVMKPILEEKVYPKVLLIFISSIAIFQMFQFGRPDHHSLILLIYTLSIGWMIRVIKKPKWKTEILLGITMAIGLWINVEFLVVILILYVVLMIKYLMSAEYIPTMYRTSIVLTISSFIFLLIEEPFTFEIVYDRLSIVYVFALAIMTTVLFLIKKYSLKNRVVTVSLYGIIGVACLLLIFPDLIYGPFSQVNDEIKRLWLSQVSEVQPLFSFSLKGLGLMMTYLGLTFVSIVSYSILLIQQKLTLEKKLLLSLMVVFTLLSLYQIRWIGYAVLTTLIPAAETMVILLRKIEEKAKPLKILFIVTYLLIWNVLGMTALAFEGEASKKSSVDLKEMCEYLETLDEGTILTFIDFGPEIMYRTDFKVIATPYHRNHEGMLYTYDTMGLEETSQIKEALEERLVDYILIAPDSAEGYFYINNENSFYSDLKSNQLPDYISAIDLPEALKAFKLFKVEWTNHD